MQSSLTKPLSLASLSNSDPRKRNRSNNLEEKQALTPPPPKKKTFPEYFLSWLIKSPEIPIRHGPLAPMQGGFQIPVTNLSDQFCIMPQLHCLDPTFSMLPGSASPISETMTRRPIHSKISSFKHKHSTGDIPSLPTKHKEKRNHQETHHRVEMTKKPQDGNLTEQRRSDVDKRDKKPDIGESHSTEREKGTVGINFMRDVPANINQSKKRKESKQKAGLWLPPSPNHLVSSPLVEVGDLKHHDRQKKPVSPKWDKAQFIKERRHSQPSSPSHLVSSPLVEVGDLKHHDRQKKPVSPKWDKAQFIKERRHSQSSSPSHLVTSKASCRSPTIETPNTTISTGHRKPDSLETGQTRKSKKSNSPSTPVKGVPFHKPVVLSKLMSTSTRQASVHSGPSSPSPLVTLLNPQSSKASLTKSSPKQRESTKIALNPQSTTPKEDKKRDRYQPPTNTGTNQPPTNPFWTGTNQPPTNPFWTGTNQPPTNPFWQSKECHTLKLSGRFDPSSHCQPKRYPKFNLSELFDEERSISKEKSDLSHGQSVKRKIEAENGSSKKPKKAKKASMAELTKHPEKFSSHSKKRRDSLHPFPKGVSEGLPSPIASQALSQREGEGFEKKNESTPSQSENRVVQNEPSLRPKETEARGDSEKKKVVEDNRSHEMASSGSPIGGAVETIETGLMTMSAKQGPDAIITLGVAAIKRELGLSTTDALTTTTGSSPQATLMGHSTFCCFKCENRTLCGKEVSKGERLCPDHKLAPELLKLKLGLNPIKPPSGSSPITITTTSENRSEDSNMKDPGVQNQSLLKDICTHSPHNQPRFDFLPTRESFMFSEAESIVVATSSMNNTLGGSIPSSNLPNVPSSHPVPITQYSDQTPDPAPNLILSSPADPLLPPRPPLLVDHSIDSTATSSSGHDSVQPVVSQSSLTVSAFKSPSISIPGEVPTNTVSNQCQVVQLGCSHLQNPLENQKYPIEPIVNVNKQGDSPRSLEEPIHVSSQPKESVSSSTPPTSLKVELAELNRQEEHVQDALVETEAVLSGITEEMAELEEKLSTMAAAKKQVVKKRDELTRQYQEVLGLKQNLLFSKCASKCASALVEET